MIRNLRLAAFFVLSLTLLPGSPLVTVAAAYQCQELTEYVEIWDDSEELNPTMGFYARGVAESGEPCSVVVRTYIKGPDDTELASAFGSGSGYATSTAVIYLDENSAEGSYTGKTEAWSQGVHYGCAVVAGFVSIVEANYIKSFESQSFCSYLRCDDGHCPQITGKKILFSGGVCSQFQHIKSVRINYVLFAMCLARNPVPIPSCQGEVNVSAVDPKGVPHSEPCLSRAGIVMPRGE